MYVKVTAGDQAGIKGDFLTKVYPPIYSDYIAAPLGKDAEWKDDFLVHPGHIDFAEAIGADINHLYMMEFVADRTAYEEAKDIIAFRYVWWNDPDTGLTAVITTRKIFIIGENGKTIDSV